MRRFFLLLTGAASLGAPALLAQKGNPGPAVPLAPPVVRIITGNPLTINIGDDNSFQVFNSAIPGSGQIFPTSCTTTADMGVFARIGSTLIAPNFSEHPCVSATGSIGVNTPWTPFSISSVTGTGTAASPFTVTVVSDGGATGLRLTMTVTYVNGDNFFRKNLTFSSTSGTINFDVFVGADIFLAASDSGIPYQEPTSGSPGGRDCPTQNYTILLIPLTAANRYSGNFYSTVWSQIGAGSLSNTIATGCIDNGAALQWQNRSVSAGNPTTIQTATSFGTIPSITQFRVDSVTPNQGNPGQTLTVVVAGIGFQAGTTFSFGAGITVNSTTINSSTQATLSISIASSATAGFRDVLGTQSTGGLTNTLSNGFQVLGAAAPVEVPTLSTFGLICLGLLIAGLGYWLLRNAS